MENILVIRYGTIGDSVFAGAFYRELRNAEPTAKIDILVDPIAKEVMENCPYINNIHLIEGKYKHFFRYYKLFRKYDTVYFLKNDNFFTKVAFISGVKNRIGFDVKRNKFLTKKSPYDENRHEIDCYLDLLRITEINIKSDIPQIWLSESNNKKIEELLQGISEPKVVIQAYSRFKQKNWIDSSWREVIKYLVKECNVKVFCAGGNKDISAYNKLIEQLDPDIRHNIINISGLLSIQESMSLISKADMVIGVDSGLMHVAAALDIPSIFLHGATSLKRWKPRSDKCIVVSKNFGCSPCCLQSNSKKYCKNQTSKCMLALKPEMLIEILRTHFKNTLISIIASQ